jgi:hypothetical protein
MLQYKKFWDNFNEDLLNDIRYERFKNKPSFSDSKLKNEYDEQFLLLMLFIALIASMTLLYESLLNL